MEIVAQSFSGLSSTMGEHAGQPVTAGTRDERAKSPSDPTGSLINIRLSNGTTYRVGLVFSAALVAAFEDGEDDEEQPRTPAPGKGKVSEMDLVYNVELPVTVSFGRTYLPLRDILKLTAGSIIELDQLISEPVDLVINNCVVARGEVVVIDGNYGVRILEIVNRVDRLALRNPGRPLPAYEEFQRKTGS
jgi:flagellar motor switch protein FliN/FliY